MAMKTVQRAKYEDFEIMENKAKVGTIRVKPSGILWKPKGKQAWFRISVEEFSEYAEKNGTEQKK